MDKASRYAVSGVDEIIYIDVVVVVYIVEMVG